MIKREDGFTLIELLSVVALMAILFTLGAFALRNFWLVRALESGQDEVTSELRRLQQRAVAETHPLVYGARFPKGGNDSVKRLYGLVRFDANDLAVAGDDTCEEFNTLGLPDGVQVHPAAVASGIGTGFANDAVTQVCRSNITGVTAGNPSNDSFVFFFARGNATGGQVTLVQTALEDQRRRTVCVASTTGRVDAIEPGDSC